jgi:hypothetical protein
MKKIIFLSAIAIALVLGSCSNSSSGKTGADSIKSATLDTTKLASGATFYQCSMHPEVTSDKPGTCPKCNMDLSKVQKK